MFKDFKYLIGIVLAICLMAWVSSSKASELDDLLKNKVVEYNGICRIDKFEMLTFEDGEDVKNVRCVVGVEPPDMDMKYVLLFDEKGPVALLKFSLEKRAQQKIWSRGAV